MDNHHNVSFVILANCNRKLLPISPNKTRQIMVTKFFLKCYFSIKLKICHQGLGTDSIIQVGSNQEKICDTIYWISHKGRHRDHRTCNSEMDKIKSKDTKGHPWSMHFTLQINIPQVSWKGHRHVHKGVIGIYNYQAKKEHK